MRKRFWQTVQYVFLCVLSVSVLYPLFWVFMSSVKKDEDVFLYPWALPRTINLASYQDVFINYKLHLNVLNSIIVSTLSVAVILFLSMLAAYGLTRLKWRASKWVLGFILLGILIPVHSTLIPLYINLQQLRGIINPKLVLLLPYAAFGLPTSILILAGYFSKLPRELEESAVLDGCSLIRAFFRIIVPASTPALATVGIFSFMGAWNELLFALVFLIRTEDQTIPVAILKYMGAYSTEWSKVLASIVVTIAPSLIVYVILQNKIVQGMTAGSIKI